MSVEQAMKPPLDRGRTIEALVEAVNDHDTYTGGHSVRVADIATQLGRSMGLGMTELDLVRRAGFVHDIGKIGIPDHILKKKGPLTDAEFQLIRFHPILGASILSRLTDMDDLVPVVLHHHEQWDGRGYPTGLSGLDSPLAARIIFVADAFDAMTTDRPYGKTLTTEEALQELRANSGRQFDPLIVKSIHEAYSGGHLEAAGARSDLPRHSLAF
jgi:putative nucleotidyltransferase with HDIG domain